jgi:hypothetical protein
LNEYVLNEILELNDLTSSLVAFPQHTRDQSSNGRLVAFEQKGKCGRVPVLKSSNDLRVVDWGIRHDSRYPEQARMAHPWGNLVQSLLNGNRGLH